MRRKGYVFAAVVALLTSLWGVAFAQPVGKLEGFGGYRFGMTLEEARKVRKDAKVTDCEFVDVHKCLTYTTEFYGQEAEVNVQINSKTRVVGQIVVSFRRFDPGPPGQCVTALKTVGQQLLRIYGAGSSPEKRVVRWYFPKGGVVSISNFCITDDIGLVVVSYRYSETL